MKFDNCVGYIPLKEPIKFDGFEAIGYFPYCAASIRVQVMSDNTCPPRSLFSEIENKLRVNHIQDNKFVVIFEDSTNFATEDFAIYFKDLYCKVGNWDSVKQYNGDELKKN